MMSKMEVMMIVKAAGVSRAPSLFIMPTSLFFSHKVAPVVISIHRITKIHRGFEKLGLLTQETTRFFSCLCLQSLYFLKLVLQL